MNMMNKCAKFHKDSPSDKKLNSISRTRLNFRRRPILCTTLYRNFMQASNFGGTFDQLFLRIFLWNFHRRCLSTFSIRWCKKVKNDQKLKSRGTMVQKSQKWPKTQIKGGSCLKSVTNRETEKVFAEWKKKAWSTKFCLRYFIFCPWTEIFQNFVIF